MNQLERRLVPRTKGEPGNKASWNVQARTIAELGSTIRDRQVNRISGAVYSNLSHITELR